jgi:hypothetical protein
MSVVFTVYRRRGWVLAKQYNFRRTVQKSKERLILGLSIPIPERYYISADVGDYHRLF